MDFLLPVLLEAFMDDGEEEFPIGAAVAGVVNVVVGRQTRNERRRDEILPYLRTYNRHHRPTGYSEVWIGRYFSLFNLLSSNVMSVMTDLGVMAGQ